MNSTITQALQGLYKKMTGNTANGKTKVQVLNEISASMGATKNSYTTAKCINDITNNYTPGGGGGGSNFKIANVTIISNSFDESYVPNINESATAYLEIESGNTNAQIIVYEDYPTIFEVANQSVQSVTGDINKPEGESFALIYGDGTITIG